MQSPFLLDKRDNYDKRYCDQPDKIGIDTLTRYDDFKNQDNYNSLFAHFTYCAIEEERKRVQKTQERKIKENNTITITHKKHHSKSNTAFSRHENRNMNSNQNLINNNSNSNNTINLNENQQLNKTNSTSNYNYPKNKRHQHTITVNLPKTDIPLNLIQNDLQIGDNRYSGSFHSHCNINTNNKESNNNNNNHYHNISKQINKKELEIGIGKPPRKFTRSVSNLSSSPFSDKNRAIDYIQKKKDKNTKNSSHFYKGSMKNLCEYTENSSKKYSVLSSANKPPKSKNCGSANRPFNNSNRKKQISGQKVDFTSNHNKNITSQCTPMISTNCTIYPTKKKQNDKIYLSNISSVVNSLIKDYKINFHSRSLSSSKGKSKPPVLKTNIRKTNNISSNNNIKRSDQDYHK